MYTLYIYIYRINIFSGNVCTIYVQWKLIYERVRETNTYQSVCIHLIVKIHILYEMSNMI